MKIGLSYSRCVRDIVEGLVDINDVLIIISRTDFDPHDDGQWAGIWAGYAGSGPGSYFNVNQEWSGYEHSDAAHEKMFRDVTIELYDKGKLHQPRQFGVHPRRLPYYWLETVLPNDELARNPAAKQAWNSFQVIAGLTSVKLNKEA